MAEIEYIANNVKYNYSNYIIKQLLIVIMTKIKK